MTAKIFVINLGRLTLLAVVLLLAASCGGSKKGTATTANPPPPSATKTGTTTTPGKLTTTATTTVETGKATTTPSTSGGSGGGQLVMGQRDLYPLLGGSLKRYTPTQVTGKGVTVVAVEAPDAFWVGKSAKESVLVKIRLKGKSAPKVKVGQKVDFVGSLIEASPGPQADSLGVKGPAGIARLAKQAAYVDVSVADMKLR